MAMHLACHIPAQFSTGVVCCFGRLGTFTQAICRVLQQTTIIAPRLLSIESISLPRHQDVIHLFSGTLVFAIRNEMEGQT